MKLAITGFVSGLALGSLGLTLLVVAPEAVSMECASTAMLHWTLDLTNHQLSVPVSGVTATCHGVEAVPSFLSSTELLKGISHVR